MSTPSSRTTASALASRLQKDLIKLVSGNREVLRELSFENMYGTGFKLVAHEKQGKHALRLLYKSLKIAASMHVNDKDKYMFVAAMLRDVFLFGINSRFGGHAPPGFDISVEIECVWSASEAKRGSLRARV